MLSLQQQELRGREGLVKGMLLHLLLLLLLLGSQLLEKLRLCLRLLPLNEFQLLLMLLMLLLLLVLL